MAAKVELGSCNFLRSNVNYLHQSLQIYGQKDPNVQQYRLVWTDGQSVWILPVNFQSNGKETSCTTTSAQEPSLVGEFDGFVFGVSCSAFTWGSNGSFISVILKEKVVVLFRQPGKTVVKVVKEYPTVFVPQCCEWHPYHPILAVLCKTSAMLLCFSEELDCIVVPVQTSDRILQTCSWSNDGRSLGVAVEESLCIFTWTELREPKQFSFVQWNSLELTGKIKCIVTWQSSSFIVATELPLDKLCGINKTEGDFFEVENESQTYQNGPDSFDKSLDDAEHPVLVQKTNHELPSMLKLKPRKLELEQPVALAQVVAICCEGPKPYEMCRTSIQGLISPELLLFQPLTKSVVVGSHCCSKLHCYSLQTSTLTGKTEFQAQKEVIELDPNYKPKGICTIPGDGQSFLCLLGQSKEPANLTAFPPSTNTDQYDVSLKCFTTVPSKDCVRKSDGTFDQQENNDQSCEDSPSLRLPDGSVFNGLIKVVENENASLISELKPSHSNGEISDHSKEVIKEDLSSCLKQIKELRSTMMSTLSEITANVAALEKRIIEMTSNNMDEKHKCPLYPLQDAAEFVCVMWTDELTGAVEQENFLLDKGRLKLKTVKQAFNASLMKLLENHTIRSGTYMRVVNRGNLPCIVSSGEGGFIPMRFVKGSTVQMSGHSKHQYSSKSQS